MTSEGQAHNKTPQIFRATLKIHNNSPKLYQIWRRWQPRQVVPLGATLFPTHTCCFSVYSVVRGVRCIGGFSGPCDSIVTDLPLSIRTVPNRRVTGLVWTKESKVLSLAQPYKILSLRRLGLCEEKRYRSSLP
ncbi:uncharacterized protein LOC134766044 [Penaeus indicus]|uniref:uncharacterized protein LOC134766044 n=1 Tax=Penaeus indicus TaxID=29960 RepID=UPI00300C46D4